MHLRIVTCSYLKFVIARDLLCCNSTNHQSTFGKFPKHLHLLRAEIGTYLHIVGQLFFCFPWIKYLHWSCFGLRRAEMRTEFGCKFQMDEWAVKLAMTSTPFWKCQVVSKVNVSPKPQISELSERHSNLIPTGAEGARELFCWQSCHHIKVAHMVLRLHFLLPQQIPKNRTGTESLTLATAFRSKLA